MRAVTACASRQWLLYLLMAVLACYLSACQSGMAAVERQNVPLSDIATPVASASATAASLFAASPTLPPQSSATPSRVQPTVVHTNEDPSPNPTPTSALLEAVQFSVEDWKNWPVIPQVPENARRLYQRGIALGNDPHAFSIIGDCQSLPETFLGVYDTDPELVSSLPSDLQAAIRNFAGSFNRQSPTIKGGTTAGAVLWDEWHERKFTCQSNETPLDCELRLHKPSIVLINLGTHYETRNITYLRKILDKLTAQGIVPILATKADNRELDDRLNLENALLAAEYKIPLWNFYSAVSDLPNHGVGVKKGEEFLGEIYLSDEGLERHRFTALQALTTVWMAVSK